MPSIPTKLHAVLDYAGGAGSLAAPRLLRDRRVSTIVAAAGTGTLLTGALTDYELGIRRLLPMRAHLAADAATGALLLAAAGFLRRRGASLIDCAPLALVGVAELSAAAITERVPGDRREPGTEASPRAATSGSAGPAAEQSGVERAERVDAALTLGQGRSPTGDALVAEQENAAAAEAAGIGGVVSSETGDPAMDPVYEAGGGEQEGWEEAEEELIENASHGDGHGDPGRDAFSAELEADRSTAVFGEADRIPSTEVVEDPAGGSDDPGAGPGLAAERGPGVQPDQDPQD